MPKKQPSADPVKRGRRPKPDAQKRQTQLSIRLRADEYDRIYRAAEAAGLSLTDWIVSRAAAPLPVAV